MDSSIAIFVPCFINKIEPKVGIEAIEILKKFNLDIIIPEGQTCCGQPFYNSGFQRETLHFAKNFIDLFYKINPKKIISLSSSCYGFIKNHYEELPLKDKEREKFKEIKEKFFDFYYFLDNLIPPDFKFLKNDKRVYLHPSCHLLREALSYKNLKNILLKVEGLEIIEEKIPFCCGFGGTFSIKCPEISVEMAKRKFKMVKEKKPHLFLIPDTSCYLHLNSLKDEIKEEIQVKNLLSFLKENLV